MSELERLIQQYCPNGVEYKCLGDCCVIKTGKGVTKKDIVEDGQYEIISGGVMPLGRINVSNRDGHNVTIARAGSAGFVDWHEKPFYLNDKCFSIIPIYSDKIDTKYLYYVLKNQEVKIVGMKSDGSVPTVNTEKVSSVEIPLPPLPVQQEIVRILDKFTLLRQELSEQLSAELNARKKQYEYYRDELLTFGDDVEWKPLGEICKFQNGFAFKSGLFKDDGIPILRITNIDDNQINMDNLKYINVSDYKEDLSSYFVKRNDIVVAMSGATTGKIGINLTDNVFLLNQRVGKFIPYTEILLNRFLYHFLLTKTGYLYQVSGGGAQPNLSTDTIKKLSIPVLPLETQRKIVCVLDNFSSLCSDISSGLLAEIEARQKKYEYYRDKLLTFKRVG